MRSKISTQKYSFFSKSKNSRVQQSLKPKRNDFLDIFNKFSKPGVSKQVQRNSNISGLELDQTFYFQVAAITILTFAIVLFFQSFLGGENVNTVASQRQDQEVRLLTNFQYVPQNSVNKGRLQPVEVVIVPEKSEEIEKLEIDQKAELEKSLVKHIVKSGENIYTIADDYKLDASKLITANNLQDPSKIRVGQELIIP